MYTLLVILAVIVAVLLAFIVLIQESKGGCLSSSFASSNQIMGVRKTTDFIEKLTWGLAILMVLFCMFSALCIQPNGQQESVTKSMKTEIPAAQQAPAAAPATTTPAN